MTTQEYSSITEDVVLSNIHDVELDTVGFSLFLAEVNSEKGYSTLQLKTTVNTDNELTVLHE